MGAPAFEAVEEDYLTRWDALIVPDAVKKHADKVALQILFLKRDLVAVQEATNVPWWWIGCVWYRESDLNPNTHLHNGDPLTARTVHVPAGRPRNGEPPFTWSDSAIDALKMRGLEKVDDWTFARACYEWEGYNGWGYRGKGVTSPYLWSQSNQHVKGKYVADHVYSASAIDAQLGTVTILNSLVALSPEKITFSDLDDGDREVTPALPVPTPAAPSETSTQTSNDPWWLRAIKGIIS